MQAPPRAVARPLAVVTGGGSGIGAAIVSQLADDGFDVLSVSRSGRPARGDDDAPSDQHGAVVAFQCDVTHGADVAALRDAVDAATATGGARRGLALLVLCAGTFAWDDDARSDGLLAVNFVGRRDVLRALRDPLLRAAPGVVVVVGSHAGAPNFVAEIEAREGPGAADGERRYIAAMRQCHAWALAGGARLHGEGAGARVSDDADGGAGHFDGGAARLFAGLSAHLFEPSLVATSMARREFARITAIDWSQVPCARNCAKGIWRTVLAIEPALAQIARAAREQRAARPFGSLQAEAPPRRHPRRSKL